MITINELLTLLRGAPKPDGKVSYAFGWCLPTTIESWRGIYAQPALGWQPYHACTGEPPTVASLIKELEEAIDGREFTGWKGGQYSYTGDEPLHVDNPGEVSHTVIERVEISDWGRVTLHTASNEDW